MKIQLDSISLSAVIVAIDSRINAQHERMLKATIEDDVEAENTFHHSCKILRELKGYIMAYVPRKEEP